MLNTFRNVRTTAREELERAVGLWACWLRPPPHSSWQKEPEKLARLMQTFKPMCVRVCGSGEKKGGGGVSWCRRRTQTQTLPDNNVAVAAVAIVTVVAVFPASPTFVSRPPALTRYTEVSGMQP